MLSLQKWKLFGSVVKGMKMKNHWGIFLGEKYSVIKMVNIYFYDDLVFGFL